MGLENLYFVKGAREQKGWKPLHLLDTENSLPMNENKMEIGARLAVSGEKPSQLSE